jgi:hypothetical protein
VFVECLFRTEMHFYTLVCSWFHHVVYCRVLAAPHHVSSSLETSAVMTMAVETQVSVMDVDHSAHPLSINPTRQSAMKSLSVSWV